MVWSRSRSAALSSAIWLSLAVSRAAYRRRIAVEEHLLQRALPEYGEYSRRTKKLIPLTW